MLLTHGEQEEHAITFSYYHIFLMKNIIEEDDGLHFLYLTFDNVTKIQPGMIELYQYFLINVVSFQYVLVLIFTLILF